MTPANAVQIEDGPQQVTDELRTAFMAKFRETFLENAAYPWPTGRSLPEVVLDLKTFFAMLAEPAIRSIKPSDVPAAGLNAELRMRIIDFLDHFDNPGGDPMQGWPRRMPPETTPKRKSTTIRVWEVSQAMQDLLGAVALRKGGPDDGGGNDSTKWPPHANEPGGG